MENNATILDLKVGADTRGQAYVLQSSNCQDAVHGAAEASGNTLNLAGENIPSHFLGISQKDWKHRPEETQN